jgi:membrane protein implicated in regulation of membrane protease activity
MRQRKDWLSLPIFSGVLAVCLIMAITVASICLVLFFAWYFGAGYFAVYAVVFLIFAYIAVAVVKRRKLKSLREKQLSEYRSKQ